MEKSRQAKMPSHGSDLCMVKVWWAVWHMGFPWPKAFLKKPHLTCLVVQVSQYPDGLSQRTFAEGGCFRTGEPWKCLCKYPPITPTPSAPTATAHHPWRLHLDAEQQQEGGVCPHRRQGPAVFPYQGPDGSTLREDQNSFPQSKSVLFLTQRQEISVFPGLCTIPSMYPDLWLNPKTFKNLRTARTSCPLLIQVVFK